MKGIVLLVSILALAGAACSPSDDLDEGLDPNPPGEPDPDPDRDPDRDPDPDPDPDPGPDLNIRVAAGAPDSYEPGDEIELEVTVSNIGDLDAAPTKLYVYLGGASRPDAGTTPLFSLQVSALPAGERETVALSIVLPADIAPGSHAVWMQVDGEGVLDQVSTKNDWARFEFTIPGAASDCDEDPNTIIDVPDAELRAAMVIAVRRDTGSEELSCANLARVGQLNIRNKTLTSLEGVQYLTGVYRSAFENSPFPSSERHKIAGMRSLQDLDLVGLPELTSIDFLSGLTKLESLTLTSTAVTSLAPLAGLEKLRSISAEKNRLTSTAPLGQLPSLTYARLSGNQIASLGDIANSTSLTSLLMDDNQLANTSGLERLLQLEKVEIRNNGLTSLGNLRALTQLEVINFANNRLTDFEGLRGLNPRELVLAINLIASIDPVREMSGLKTLHLAQNRIADITPLAHVTGLDRLDLSNNYVSQMQALNHPDRFSGSGTWLLLSHNCIGHDLILNPINNDALANLQDWGVNVQWTPFRSIDDCS